MKRLVPIRIHVALGLLVSLVGMLVLTLATLNPSGLLAGFPALRGMSLVTAACFALAGSALWLPLADAYHIRRIIGILLCLIGSLVVLRFLGAAAMPFSGLIKPEAIYFLWPGRVSPATAACFMMVGLVLIALDSAINPKKMVLMLLGMVTIATMATLAILGHFLGVELFFFRYPEISMLSFPTALILLLLSLALFAKVFVSASFQRVYAGRADLKIYVLSILLFYCFTLAAGMAGIGMVKLLDAGEFYQTSRESLLLAVFAFIVLALLGALLLFIYVYPIARGLYFTRAKLAVSFDNLPESIITFNMQGIVQNASASTQSLFGYTPVELIGCSIDLLIPESARGRQSGYFSGNLSLEADRDRVIGLGPHEMKALHRDGSQFPIEITVSQFLFQGERLFIAIARDIRERKEAEERLSKWKRMFALAEWGIVMSESNGKILEDMNPAFARMHGYTVAELTGKNLLELIAPEVQADVPAQFALALARGHNRFESLHVHKDGHIFPVLIDVSIARSASGESLYRIANIQDISERKSADNALRQSEALLSLVLNSLPVGVFVADKEGNVIRMNPAGERIWMGKRLVGPEAYGQYIAKWADSGKPVAADDWALARAIRTGESSIDEVLKIECFDGSHKIILNSALPLRSPQGELQGAIVVNEDITVRRQAQEEMRISKEFFQSAFDSAAIGMAVCDVAGRYLNVNRALCDIVGYSEQELLALSYQDITRRDDLDSYAGLMLEMLAGRKQSFQIEKRYIRKDGREVWVLLVVSLISDKEGRPLYSISQAIDIDRQKRIEDELRMSRASLANAQRLARIGDWQWKPADNTVYWSEETFRIFGLEAGSTEASLDAFCTVVHPDDRARLRTAVKAAISQHKLFSIDHRILLAAGSERMVHSQGEVQYGPGGNLLRVIGTVQDISERKQFEQALLNSRQQLRAMSVHQEALLERERKHIAHEVHDELGQLLTGLKMDISLLRLRFGSDPALQRKVEEMRALVDRTIDVVRHVASNLRPAALDHGIVSAIEWLAEDFTHRWEIPCVVSVQGEDIVLDDSHATVVFRVVQESLTNVARHAQACEVKIFMRRGDRGLSLQIQDNGLGFDPKAVRKRQGFGLLGMRERVLALGGTLRIESAPGRGTTVLIELPFHSDENP